MSVLALISDADQLSAVQAAQQIDALRRAQDYVRACDVVDELVEARHNAEMVKTWVRLHKAAQSIAIEACKLDWLALRKIGQIDETAVAHSSTRSAARWLAAMDQAEFDRRLQELKTPMSAWSAKHDDEYEKRADCYRGIGRGERVDSGPPDAQEIAAAVNVILAVARADGMSSIEGLRQALAEQLGLTWTDYSQDVHDLIDEGIGQVVRQAMRSQDLDDGEGYPAWVTWHSETVGWVHIPWEAGTLEQLEWMADFRRSQLAGMVKSVTQLEGLVRIMRAYSARLGGAQRLETLREAREQAQQHVARKHRDDEQTRRRQATRRPADEPARRAEARGRAKARARKS